MGWREVGTVIAMLAMFLASQALAVLLLDPFKASGVERAFEDPSDPLNGVWLLAIVVVFTLLILYIARRRMERVIQGLILGSVGLTLVYVFYPLIDLVPTSFFEPTAFAPAGYAFEVNPALVLAFPFAGLLTWLLVRFPEWYIVDAVGISVSAGAIAIFGTSFTPITYVLVLVAFAVYDYVSVYKTRHMLSLADSVLDLHLPIMLVVPKTLDYSFLDERGRVREAAELGKRKPRDAMFIGLGDIVIPSIFGITALSLGAGPTIGVFAGVAVGLVVLMAFVLRGKPHAGLPTLNAGAFFGFLAGLWLERGTLVFW